MAPQLYTDETPEEVKNAKGLHLITMNTPNGQAVQVCCALPTKFG